VREKPSLWAGRRGNLIKGGVKIMVNVDERNRTS